MGERTAIQWTNGSWNPWMGCTKVSAGCKHCYMYTEQKAYGKNPALVRRSKTTFRDPLKWKEPKRIFTCSWSDFFIAEADLWRREVWEIIAATPHHTYQILTKRPERIRQCLPDDWGEGYPHVWLGVSCENQETANERIPRLLEVPAAVRFVSAEPLLGRILLDNGVNSWLTCTSTVVEAPSDPDYHCCDSFADCGDHFRGIDWVIVGGESGPRARPIDVTWIRSLLAQCAGAGVAPFVKQLGRNVLDSSAGSVSWPSGTRADWGDPMGPACQITLHDKKGGDWAEWPEELRVREFPRGAHDAR